MTVHVSEERRAIRERIFWLAPALLLLGTALLDPIAQSARYHAFADARTFFGVANFMNVATSFAFVLVGLPALLYALSRRLAPAWIVLFAAIALVGPGSAYYHSAPEDATLFWDRAPMALAFAGLIAALVGEHFSERAGRTLLLPAVLVCLASVLYWRYSGDLRFYGWVQAVAVLAVPLALWLLPARYSHRRYYLYAFACYALAKLAELGDEALYEWSGEVLSGHAAKHLLAAAGAAFLYAMLVRRTA